MKIRILLVAAACLAVLSCCKGPGSGPLVKGSFDKKEATHPVTVEKHQGRVIAEKADIKVEPCTDCITISKLYSEKNSFSGKTVRVRGQVTRFNSAIMGKNWIHLQDGTEFKGSYDLTVTTDLTVTVGETVTLTGRIILDKDFGYGYAYDVLMEDAKSAE